MHPIFNKSSVEIKLDSRNNIYSFKYYSNDNQKYYDFFSTYLQDKNIDDLKENFASHSLNLRGTDLDNDLIWDEVVFGIKNHIEEMIGGLEYSELDSEQIICRCSKVDYTKFKKYFEAIKSDKREFIRKTNMGLTCGGCKELVDTKFSELLIESSGEGVYFDMSVSEARDFILHALMGFKEYSPLSISDIIVNKLKFESDRILLTLEGVNQDIQAKLKIELTNYLCSKLNRSIDIDLAFI